MNPSSKTGIRWWYASLIVGLGQIGSCGSNPWRADKIDTSKGERQGRIIKWFDQTLRVLGTSESDRKRLAEGRLLDRVSPLDLHIFKHAEQLTRRSWITTESDIQKPREAGLDARGILQLTILCSYLNFENRVAAGLDVAPE